MANQGRTSSFLPTIKCSSCDVDIEISQLADHVCGGPSAGEPTPPPDSYRNFDRMPYKQEPSNGPGFLKPQRMMPPRVDTSAANRPYMPQDQLTPVSAGPSRSVSPNTPRSPFGRPLRSATAPIQRGPPSPEMLSSNLDCAFPPFPSTKPAPQKRNDQNGGFGMGKQMYAEPDPMYAPVSPRIESSQGVLKRMNTIVPGPFDVNGRKGPSARQAEKTHRRKVTAESLKDATTSTGLKQIVGDGGPRPATAEPGHSRSSTNSSGGSRSGVTPPRMPRANGYGGFGPPIGDANTQGALSPPDRSKTFPLSYEKDPIRRPSEPATGPGMRRPSNGASSTWPMMDESLANVSPPRNRKPSTGGPDLSKSLPPRNFNSARTGASTAPDVGAPPGPNLNLAAEFGIGNPYHTSTESQSSNTSGYSDGSKASSSSSPPRSATSQSPRKISNPNRVDNGTTEILSSMAGFQLKKLPSGQSPPRSGNQAPPALSSAPRFGKNLDSSESSMDPSASNGRLSPVPARGTARQPTREQTRQRSPMGRPSRPATAKGNCKACGEAIKGKSISSADGRLTGKYHKECFSCKTCFEPFQTATFYVHNDSPYCERHYHKLNGSVCSTCDRGIEGQYLESERKQKFHPGCLTCADCKRSLRNDYFEMNGLVYCERDAFRRTQQKKFLGPGVGGTNKMERRTTRLMMM